MDASLFRPVLKTRSIAADTYASRDSYGLRNEKAALSHIARSLQPRHTQTADHSDRRLFVLPAERLFAASGCGRGVHLRQRAESLDYRAARVRQRAFQRRTFEQIHVGLAHLKVRRQRRPVLALQRDEQPAARIAIQ